MTYRGLPADYDDWKLRSDRDDDWWNEDEPEMEDKQDVSQNKFHAGNGVDGKHYWLTPPDVYARLDIEFSFTFDPCPYPKPPDFDGLRCDWGASNYVNPPFGSIIHHGRKKGATAWVRKAIAEAHKGKRVVLVYPVDKWILMLLEAGATVRNLGDVRWLATEDYSQGPGTGRHIAAFVLDGIKAPEIAQTDLFNDLSAGQESLGAEFEAVWDKNVASLYES